MSTSGIASLAECSAAVRFLSQHESFTSLELPPDRPSYRWRVLSHPEAGEGAHLCCLGDCKGENRIIIAQDVASLFFQRLRNLRQWGIRSFENCSTNRYRDLPKGSLVLRVSNDHPLEIQRLAQLYRDSIPARIPAVHLGAEEETALIVSRCDVQ